MTLVLNVNSLKTKNDFKKCGEIATRGQNEFLLTCTFCEDVFLKLDDFIEHIGQLHLNEAFEKITIKNEIVEEVPTHVSIPQEAKANENKKNVKGKLRTVAKTRSDRNKETEHTKLEPTESLKQSCDKADPLAVLFTDAVDEHPIELLHEKNEAVESETDDNDLKDPFTDDEFDNDYICSAMEESEAESDASELSDVDLKAVKQHSFFKFSDNIKIALIAEYKLRPVLWSNDYPPKYYRGKREEAFQQIVNNVNKQLNADLEWKTVREQIQYLRKKHIMELEKQRKAKLKGKPFNPSWHFELLNFLNAEIEHYMHKYRYRDINASKETKSVSFSPELSDVQHIQLINIYKRFPCLWDVQNVEYRFQNRRQAALAEMHEAVKAELGLNLTLIELQNKISEMRDACSQEKKRKIDCDQTEASLKPTSGQYYEHVSFLEANVGPFNCAVCKKLSSTYDQHLIHKSSHGDSKPFICPLCSKGYKDAANLTVHLRHHKHDYQHECETCKKSFATLKGMTVHMQQHTGERPFFCEICGQSFGTWGFYSHMRRHQNKTPYKCNVCPKAFYKRSRLTDHIKTHLDVRAEVCKVCGKAFKTKKNLRQHELIHAAKKRYVCKICKKEFAQYGGLSGHMKTHGTTLVGSGFNGIGRAGQATFSN